jgi:hypothetical protein
LSTCFNLPALEVINAHEPIGAIARRYKVHPIQVGKWRKQLVGEMHRVFEDVPDADAVAKERENQELYEQFGGLKVENDFLKKNLLLATDDPRMLIDSSDGSMSISHQRELLSVCRSSYYYELATESPLNLILMRRIDELHLKYPFAGSRMLTGMLYRVYVGQLVDASL